SPMPRRQVSSAFGAGGRNRMGDTLWGDVRGRTDDGPLADNTIMLALSGYLDRLCERVNVAEPRDFHHGSVLGAEGAEWTRRAAEEFGLRIPDLPTPEPAWFDPGPALAAVRAVVAHLEQHPDGLRFRPDASQAHWPEQLLEELRDCVAAL